jgi:acyl dehydratase
MLYTGKKWEHSFLFTQEDVNVFAQVTGDINPIHLDEEYASKSIFKKRVVHGALSNSIFSKVFGTITPGEGTIYLSQNSKFTAPMYTDVKYVAKFEVVEVKENGISTVETNVYDILTSELTITGNAKLKI